MYPFKEKMKNGKTVVFGQSLNGMHWAEIRDEYNAIESATTCKTPSDVWRWIEERENDSIG